MVSQSSSGMGDQREPGGEPPAARGSRRRRGSGGSARREAATPASGRRGHGSRSGGSVMLRIGSPWSISTSRSGSVPQKPPQRADFQMPARRPMTATPTAEPSATCVTESMARFWHGPGPGLRRTGCSTPVPVHRCLLPLCPARFLRLRQISRQVRRHRATPRGPGRSPAKRRRRSSLRKEGSKCTNGCRGAGTCAAPAARRRWCWPRR